MAQYKGLSFFLVWFSFFDRGNLYFISTTSSAFGLFITAAAWRKPKGDVIKPDCTAKHII